MSIIIAMINNGRFIIGKINMRSSFLEKKYHHLPDALKKVADIFNVIYHAAKSKDAEVFLNLKSKFISVDNNEFYSFVTFGKPNYLTVVINGLTPTQLLAFEGDHEAVGFLISQGARVAEAIFGYAMSGDEKRVETFFSPKNSKVSYVENALDFAASRLLGFARGGHKEKVEEIISQAKNKSISLPFRNNVIMAFPTIDIASIGYAAGQWTDHVDDLFNRGANKDTTMIGYGLIGDKVNVEKLLANGVTYSTAIVAYAAGGHIKEIEELMSRCWRINILANFVRNYGVAHAILTPGYLYPETLSCLLVHTQNETLRSWIISMIKDENGKTFSPFTLLSDEKMNKLNEKIREYEFTQNQAMAWLRPDIHHWVFIGIELVRMGNIKPDFFMHILSYFAPSLDQIEIKELADKVTFQFNKKFLVSDLDNYTAGFFNRNTHKQRAQSLAVVCKESQSIQALSTLVRHQQGLFSGNISGNSESKKAHEQPLASKTEDGFTQAIAKYSRRLS